VNGDVLHFGNVEYRVISQQSVSPLAAQDCGDSTMMFSGSLSNQLAMGSRELDELLNHAMVTMHFQPIVTPSGEIRAFEILGRGNHPVLPASPLELFSLAESVGEAVRLSEVFRDSGVALAAGQTELPLFLNIHPHELNDCDRLLRSLVSLREKYPCQALMLEIHEQVVTNLDKMHQIKRVLTELDIGLAYDDFGAGQARMLELVEIPPKCLKFDTSLVRGIATGSSQKRQVLAMLITLCKQLGIQSLAEGIETREDAEVCQLLGVDLIQGFFYSRPKPWDEVEKKQI
jgi:EAL domain-containing protein (putative c-di-GMP-specific phosphodiesterase class I)